MKVAATHLRDALTSDQRYEILFTQPDSLGNPDFRCLRIFTNTTISHKRTYALNGLVQTGHETKPCKGNYAWRRVEADFFTGDGSGKLSDLSEQSFGPLYDQGYMLASCNLMA